MTMYDLRLTEHLAPANFDFPNPRLLCRLEAQIAVVKLALALAPTSGSQAGLGEDEFEWLDPSFLNM